MSMVREQLEAQVLVIGSGAGGAVTAAALAEAGQNVLVLEDGPAVDTRHLATHTPKAMRMMYRNGGLSPIIGKANIAFVEGRCVGGSTEINSAFWHRAPAEAILRWAREYAIRDLTPESMLSLYQELEGNLGVQLLNGVVRPKSSELLKAGADELGWAVMEVPRAQMGDLTGSQFAPGAKRSMSRTFIPRAIEAGARLISDCRVSKIHWSRDRVSHVTAIHRTDDGPRELRINADRVVVSAGAIQTPVLLRASGIKRNIGNSLRIHPMLKVAALYNEVLDSHRAPLPVYQVKEFWPEITLGGSVFTPGYLAMTLSENWPELQPVLSDWRRMALFHAACRGTNRGSIRPSPLNGEAIIRYDVSEQDRIHLSAGLGRLCEALFASGARRLYPGLRKPAVINTVEECRALVDNPVPLKDMSVSTVHVFSTCPIGDDPQRCAADSFGKVHGFSNLYVSDASIIPDSPGVNPQGTTMALALRNARHLLSQEA